jgi:hypothetical protein
MNIVRPRDRDVAARRSEARETTSFAVSVIIPTFRNRDRVIKAIESVLAQPQVEAQIIVVIDDQCIATREEIAGYGGRVAIIFNDRNRGACYSRNAGLARATAPYCMFLDSDDFVEGPLLAGICRSITASSADLGFGRAALQYDRDCLRTLLPAPDAERSALFVGWMTGRSYVPPCSVVWKTDYVRSIGGWDEDLRRNQDGELAMRALLLGARTCFSAEGVGVYVQHDGWRITRSTDQSLALVSVEKILAIESDAIARPVVERAAALRAWQIGLDAFQPGGNAAAGKRALAIARELGFDRNPHGSRLAMLDRIVGVQGTQRVKSVMKACLPAGVRAFIRQRRLA